MATTISPAVARALGQRVPRTVELSPAERAHKTLAVAVRRGDRDAEDQALALITKGDTRRADLAGAIVHAWIRELGSPDLIGVCDHYAWLLGLDRDAGWTEWRGSGEQEMREYAAHQITSTLHFYGIEATRDELITAVADGLFWPASQMLGEAADSAPLTGLERVHSWFMNTLNLKLRDEPSFTTDNWYLGEVGRAFRKIDLWGPLTPTLADLLSGSFGVYLVKRLAPGTLDTLNGFLEPGSRPPRKLARAKWIAFRNLLAKELDNDD